MKELKLRIKYARWMANTVALGWKWSKKKQCWEHNYYQWIRIFIKFLFVPYPLGWSR